MALFFLGLYALAVTMIVLVGPRCRVCGLRLSCRNDCADVIGEKERELRDTIEYQKSLPTVESTHEQLRRRR